MNLTLDRLRSLEDLALLFLRLFFGLFLIWGVSDNIVSETDMGKFVDFLSHHRFPVPEISARMSVLVQSVCGICFVLGLLTRWAGLLCAINFLIAIIMVDYKLGIRGAFPAGSILMVGLFFAARGCGRYGCDEWISRLERKTHI